jgi:uncharacterized membrane protein YqjE
VNANQAFKEVLAWVTWALTLVIQIGLLILIATAVAAEFRFTTPMLPVVQWQTLAWAAGAWFLYQGKKIV